MFDLQEKPYQVTITEEDFERYGPTTDATVADLIAHQDQSIITSLDIWEHGQGLRTSAKKRKAMAAVQRQSRRLKRR